MLGYKLVELNYYVVKFYEVYLLCCVWGNVNNKFDKYNEVYFVLFDCNEIEVVNVYCYLCGVKKKMECIFVDLIMCKLQDQVLEFYVECVNCLWLMGEYDYWLNELKEVLKIFFDKVDEVLFV